MRVASERCREMKHHFRADQVLEREMGTDRSKGPRQRQTDPPRAEVAPTQETAAPIQFHWHSEHELAADLWITQD